MMDAAHNQHSEARPPERSRPHHNNRAQPVSSPPVQKCCAAPSQRIVRLGLVPMIMGLVIASDVMVRAADTSWRAVAVTIAAALITLATRLSPMWMLLVGVALGGFGLL